MVESKLTNNEIVVGNSVVKKNPLKIIFLFIFLIFLGIAFYFFKDLILSKFIKKDVINNPTNSTEISEERNPFNALISDTSTEENSEKSGMTIQDYLKIYEGYKMGDQGFPAKFESFDKNSMTMKVNLLVPGDGEKLPKEYSLNGDFVILCEKIDPCCTYIDYSKLKDTQKSNIAISVTNVSLDKKISLLENYEKDRGIGLIFENHSSFNINNDNFKVKKILLKIDNPESCYEE